MTAPETAPGDLTLERLDERELDPLDVDVSEVAEAGELTELDDTVDPAATMRELEP